MSLFESTVGVVLRFCGVFLPKKFVIFIKVLCLIVSCGNKMGKKQPNAEKLSFFRVPYVVVNQGEFIEEITAERRRRWISAISRDDLTDFILQYDQVCSKHFVSGQGTKD